MKSEHVESIGRVGQAKEKYWLVWGSGFAAQGADVVALVAHMSAQHTQHSCHQKQVVIPSCLVMPASNIQVMLKVYGKSATCRSVKASKQQSVTYSQAHNELAHLCVFSNMKAEQQVWPSTLCSRILSKLTVR